VDDGAASTSVDLTHSLGAPAQRPSGEVIRHGFLDNGWNGLAGSSTLPSERMDESGRYDKIATPERWGEHGGEGS
ncbi:hypothetical protein Q2333_24595, partial [Escherichia coli]|nr:hypothetical protein [Escherichia coli]